MLFRVWLAMAVMVPSVACKQLEPSEPLVVHVLRNGSSPFGKTLRQIELDYALVSPPLANGRAVMVATVESDFHRAMRQRDYLGLDLVIFDSEPEIPPDLTSHGHFRKAAILCGQHPAFVSTSISGDEREGTEIYLRYLDSHCDVKKASEPVSRASKTTSTSVLFQMFPNAPHKTETSKCFRSLTHDTSIYAVVDKCGRPDEELGSGLYIFVYHLPDGMVAIGTPNLNRVMSVTYTDLEGSRIALLPAK